MCALNIIVLLLFLAGFLWNLKRTEDWMEKVDKKEHKLYVLYPLVNYIMKKTGLIKILTRKSNSNASIKALYVTSKPEVLNQLFWCNRISLIMVILILFNFLSLISCLAEEGNSVIIDGFYLERPDYGEGSTEVELSVAIEQQGGEDTSKSEFPKSELPKSELPNDQEVTIDVGERIYSQEDISELFDKSVEYLNKEVLGENESAELINHELNFCETIPGTSITVDWRPEDYSLIRSDGTIANENITEEGINTAVKAILSYQGNILEHRMSFTIRPKKHSEEEIFQKKLMEAIKAYSEKTAVDQRLELPGELGNYSLHWAGKEEKNGPTLLIFGIILAIIVWFYGEKELENRMKKRKEQMLLDYPEIINKFTLLINAGMTIKQAWTKIAEDYNSKTLQKGVKKRYAYEEMLTTVHELQLGLAENIAYEQYGRRTGLISYIKFSSLISQNLKKGTKGFTQLLLQEAIEAFEDRKETAKRLGEEAGTKLLIPMMIMLIIVFLMIMIPAFMAFRA